MIGTTIEHYQITDRLGGGGMGDVYRGVDLELDRQVAIKCVRADLADIKDITRRFREEARTLAKLSHSNIATVYHFFARDEQLFLVMEYVSGSHFGSMLRQQGAMEYGRAVQLVRQALAGLGYAHSNKVVHRDIKPANLMVDSGGAVKVLDFGIAHVLDQTRLTRTGGVLGTPAYMAPEQALGRTVDGRTDIYSIGIVLYELLTGDLPFQANSDFELMRAHVEVAPRSLNGLSKSIPTGLQQAVMKSLSKDTAERFQTAEEFAEALRSGDVTKVSAPVRTGDVSAGMAAQVLANTLVEKAVSPATRAAMVGAAIALTIVAAFWLLSGPGDATPEANQPQPAATQTATTTPPPAGGDVQSATGRSTTGNADAGTPAAAVATESPSSDAEATQPADARDAVGSSTADSASAALPTRPAPTAASLPAARTSQSRQPAAPPLPSVKVRKIAVHERQGTGRFSRAAGYNGDFDLQVPGGAATPVQIDEFIEVRRDGQQVLREFVRSASHRPGVFESKQRVRALKELDPGMYDIRLVLVFDGRTLGSHDWKLEVVD